MVKKPNTGMVGSVFAISDCSPETTRLVLVPMSVQVPPSTVAKDSGMSSFFTGTLQLRGGCFYGQLGAHWPICRVFINKVLAVFITSTLFWYPRAVSIMSTSSRVSSTAAYPTTVFPFS